MGGEVQRITTNDSSTVLPPGVWRHSHSPPPTSTPECNVQENLVLFQDLVLPCCKASYIFYKVGRRCLLVFVKMVPIRSSFRELRGIINKVYLPPIYL